MDKFSKMLLALYREAAFLLATIYKFSLLLRSSAKRSNLSPAAAVFYEAVFRLLN